VRRLGVDAGWLDGRDGGGLDDRGSAREGGLDDRGSAREGGLEGRGSA
jgi:hypothetical protein